MKKVSGRIRRFFHYGEKGFTLIELLIVIAVLGILAGVAVPNVAGFLRAGNVQAANTEAANVETAGQAYYGATGAFPADSTVLAPTYISAAPKAKYYFSADTGRIGNAAGKYVDIGAAPVWATTYQYDISERRWLVGTDDADADNGTQTIP